MAACIEVPTARRDAWLYYTGGYHDSADAPMRQLRLRILLAAALGCSLLALSAPGSARADQPAEAIRSDAHHLAADVHREARVVGHQAQKDAHELHRQLQAAREHVSLQMHHLGQRIQRWWSRVRTS